MVYIRNVPHRAQGSSIETYIYPAFTGHFIYIIDQMEWLNEFERPSPVLVGYEVQIHRFEAWSSQTIDFKHFSCHYLAWFLVLLG